MSLDPLQPPLIHATCLALGEDGVMLRGPSGSGKSSLALRLIDQGAALVGDDYCCYDVRNARLWASPQPALAGLLEVRGMGIIRLPHRPTVALRVIIDLDPKLSERLPPDTFCEIFGIPLPCYRLNPFYTDACAKVRLAVGLATGNIKAMR